MTSRRIASLGFGASAAIAALMSAAWFVGLRVNTTASFPRGIYRLVDESPRRDDLVFFKLPFTNPATRWARANGVLPWRFGLPPVLLKRVVGLPGDRITVTDHVAIDGRTMLRSKLLLYDDGVPIPHLAHTQTLGTNQFFLMSDYNPYSFDSRYFGPIDRKEILGVAHPLFLIDPPSLDEN